MLDPVGNVVGIHRLTYAPAGADLEEIDPAGDTREAIVPAPCASVTLRPLRLPAQRYAIESR